METAQLAAFRFRLHLLLIIYLLTKTSLQGYSILHFARFRAGVASLHAS
jgi:hypothetical protein